MKKQRILHARENIGAGSKNVGFYNRCLHYTPAFELLCCKEESLALHNNPSMQICTCTYSQMISLLHSLKSCHSINKHHCQLHSEKRRLQIQLLVECTILLVSGSDPTVEYFLIKRSAKSRCMCSWTTYNTIEKLCRSNDKEGSLVSQ